MGRIGRVAFPAILLLAAYYALFGGEYSVFDVRSARQELAAARAELERLQEENRALEARVDSLQNDLWTIERIAREEHGLVGENEELIRLTPSADDTDPASGRGREGGG